MDIFEEQITFESEDGLRLEGVVAYNPQATPQGAAVICPPHPLLAGDMDNNVVSAIATRLAQKGLVALRFNYRGVGGSQPEEAGQPVYEYWNSVEENKRYAPAFRDGVAAARIAQARAKKLWLVGYSFGCLVALHIVKELGNTVQGFVGIAAPVHKEDFSALGNVRRYLMILGGKDELFPRREVTEALSNVGGKGTVVEIEESNHFFIGHESRVGGEVIRFVGQDF